MMKRGPWQAAAGLALGAAVTWLAMRWLAPRPDGRRRATAPVEAWAEWADATDCGKVRKHNEDRLLLRPCDGGRSLLAAVADGMGGHQGGALAAEIVVEKLGALAERADPGAGMGRYEALLVGVHEADGAVRERGAHDIGLGGMGSTVVAAWFDRAGCTHLHAGDSRLYHFRDGRVRYRTRDHTVVQVLVDQGQMTEAEARTHPVRSQLTSCLGGGRSARRITVDPRWDLEGDSQAAVLEAVPGDVFLLCSDGLHGELNDAALEQIVAAHASSARGLADACVVAALEAGGSDNVAVVAVVYPC
jgi:serine/threonine protein phosphatase PrpC